MANIDLLLEEFLFDIDDVLIEDPMIMFSESMIDIDEVYHEAQDGVNRKNFITKLWNFLKKVFGLIKIGVDKLINWLKKLFHRKVKSVDQIAEDLEISKQERLLKLPKKDTDVSAAAKQVIIRFNDDNTFKVTLTHILSEEMAMNAPIKGHKYKEQNHILRTLYHMKRRETIESWISVFEKLLSEKTCDKAEIKKVLTELDADVRLENSMTTSYEEIAEFHGLINKMCAVLEKYNDTEHDLSNLDEDALRYLNALASRVIVFQMGINGISRGLQEIYKIDESYFGSVKSPELLSKFVEELILGKVPVKYVMNNIFNISDISLKGEDADPNNPKLGQSRVVLLPKDKNIVYKIAINGLGFNANKNELSVFNATKGSQFGIKLAKVIGNYGKSVLVMERINPKEVSEDFADEFEKELIAIAKREGYRFRIGDVNSGGFGIDKHGKLLLADYGQLYPN